MIPTFDFTFKFSCRTYEEAVRVLTWTPGQSVPRFGPVVGIDTETEPITDSNKHPPLVALGCFDLANNICYLVDHFNAPAFMDFVNAQACTQFYLNIGYDVLQLWSSSLADAVDAGKCIDVSIRARLKDLATRGFIRYPLLSLAGCASVLLGYKMDKGDGSETSDRLSFRQRLDITQSQAQYLAIDCICTALVGMAVPKMPNEVEHSQGSIVLYMIGANGFTIDNVVFSHYEKVLKEDAFKYRQALLSFGFPDPEPPPKEKAEDVKQGLMESLNRMLEATCGNIMQLVQPPIKAQVLRMMVYLRHYTDLGDLDTRAKTMLAIMQMPKKGLTAKEKVHAQYILEQHDLLVYDNCRKALVWPCILKTLVDNLNLGLGFDEAMIKVDEMLQDHLEWLEEAGPAVGPKKFFQDHVKQLLIQNPGLELDKTPKSGDYKLTLKDMWRLDDLNIKDPFLKAYTDYNHCRKYLSTYLNRSYIASDGMVHAHYQDLMRTGRTSCTSPNVQNLPSRDKRYPLKGIYKAPDGMLLCSTDYSFLELVAFAENCYIKYGYSTMRELINAGVDPHRWFAGVMVKLIKPDIEFTKSPAQVEKMKAFLKENVDDATRGKAKAANFGYPGGMGFRRFFHQCRETGINITLDDAREMRESWIAAFPEMRKHMNPQELSENLTQHYYDDLSSDDEELEEELVDLDAARKHLYRAQLITGMVRTRCTYNSACNFPFQGLAAIGAKKAGWFLVKAGYGPRLACFVHDEYLYCLYPEEVHNHVPAIERLMIAGMRTIIKNTKIGVESSVGINWDKHATVFADVQFDATLRPLNIIRPPNIQEMYNALAAQNTKGLEAQKD